MRATQQDIAYTIGDTSTYQTRVFRCRKDRPPPTSLRKWRMDHPPIEGQRYIEQYDYIDYYHLYTRNMFNIVYKQITGPP
mgnify:CR=1 FL=1